MCVVLRCQRKCYYIEFDIFREKQITFISTPKLTVVFHQNRYEMVMSFIEIKKEKNVIMLCIERLNNFDISVIFKDNNKFCIVKYDRKI